MSKYSGKCDFYDEIEIFGIDYILEGNVYLGDFEHKLNLKKLEDCVPYYAHIVIMSHGDTIILSEKSWPDILDERYPAYKSFSEHYRQRLQEEMDKLNK